MIHITININSSSSTLQSVE